MLQMGCMCTRRAFGNLSNGGDLKKINSAFYRYRLQLMKRVKCTELNMIRFSLSRRIYCLKTSIYSSLGFDIICDIIHNHKALVIYTPTLYHEVAFTNLFYMK